MDPTIAKEMRETTTSDCLEHYNASNKRHWMNTLPKKSGHQKLTKRGIHMLGIGGAKKTHRYLDEYKGKVLVSGSYLVY